MVPEENDRLPEGIAENAKGADVPQDKPRVDEIAKEMEQKTREVLSSEGGTGPDNDDVFLDINFDDEGDAPGDVDGDSDSDLHLVEDWEEDDEFMNVLRNVLGSELTAAIHWRSLEFYDARRILDLTKEALEAAQDKGLLEKENADFELPLESVYQAFCKIRDKDPRWMEILKDEPILSSEDDGEDEPLLSSEDDGEDEPLLSPEDDGEDEPLLSPEDDGKEKSNSDVAETHVTEERDRLLDDLASDPEFKRTLVDTLGDDWPESHIVNDTQLLIEDAAKVLKIKPTTIIEAAKLNLIHVNDRKCTIAEVQLAFHRIRSKDGTWTALIKKNGDTEEKGYLRRIGGIAQGYVRRIYDGIGGIAQGQTKKIDPLISAYRKGREQGDIIKTLDSGARTIGGGIAGYAGGQALTSIFGTGLRAAAVTGGSLFSNILAPVGFPLAVPVATLLGRRAVAKYKHEKIVDEQYMDKLKEVASRIPDGASSTTGLDTENEVIKRLDEHRDMIQSSAASKSLIDTMEEIEILEIMAKHAKCSPAEVPYLGSDSRYARYIFTRFTEVTEKLFNDPSFAPNEKNKKEVVNYFHIEEGHDPQSPSPEKKMEVLKKLWEVSQEYGRLIAYEHRKNRNKQLNGQMIGGAVVSAPLLGIVPPLLAGGAAYLARRYYTEFNKPTDIEFDAKGHLLVSPSSLKDSDDTYTLYREAVFNSELPTPTDEHTYWMNQIKFDKTLFQDKKVKNANILAFYHQQHLMKELAGKKLPPTVVKDEDKQKAESDFRSEDTALKELKTELRRCESDLKKAQSEQKKYKGILIKLDKSDPRQNAKVPELEGEIEECDLRIAELKLEAREIKEKIDGTDGQEARTRKAKNKWEALLNPAKTSLRLSSDPKKIFDINAYEKSAEEKDAEKDVEVKKKRLESMRTTFDATTYGSKYISDKNGKKERIDPDSYDVEDLKMLMDEAAYAFEDSKSEAVPAGDPSLESTWKKLKKEHNETSRLVLMIKEVKTAEDNVKKLADAKKEKLEHSFKIIREAFAMQMKQEWDSRSAGQKPSLAKNASGAALNGAKVSAQFLATQALTLAVKAAVPAGTVIATYAGLHLAGAGGLINAISTVIPPGLVVSTAAVIGIVAHLRQSLGSAGLKGIAAAFGKKKAAAEKKPETEISA